MSIDPYGTIRAQVIDLQGNAVGGAVSNNDWRLVVDNENLVFQHYDATANDNAGAYITRQSFGTGLTGISVVPLGTYSITGNLQVTDDLTVDGGTLFVDASTNRVGFGTLTPSQAVHVVGNTYVDGDLTVTGSASISSSSVWTKDGTTNEITYIAANVGIGTSNPDNPLHVNGTSKFVGNMSMTGHIIPTAANTYDLGSATNTFRHVYVGPGSLYVNGKQVITDDSNTITVSTSINQNLALKTSGTGNLQISTVGSGDIELTAGGIVQMKKTLQILDGQKITSSGGTTVVCGNNFQSEGLLRGVTFTLDGSTSIGSAQLNVLADATVGSAVAFKAVVLGENKDFTGIRNLTLTGDLTVSGTTTTVNSTTVSVADGMFKYASNNAANATDFGWYGKYVDSSVTYYSGMFRDATDNKMRFFTSTQVEPTTTVDITGTGYAKADVVVGDVDFTSGTMRGHILPDTDDTYDIGSAEFKIRDMYVSENSLWVGDNHKITIDTGGKMKFRKRKTSTMPVAVTNAGGTETLALQHSGKASLSLMKLKHWKAYMRTLSGQGSAKIKDIFRATADDYEEETGADAWLESGNNVYLGASGNVGIGDSTPTEKLEVNGAIKIGDAATTGDGTIKYASGDFLGRKAGSWVSLTAAGGGSTAETVTTAAQPAITSVGTLTTLQVDNININGNIISSTAGTDLKITPLTGQQIVLDDTIVIDAGVVTGATSITSTSFVGALTGNATTATTLATARTIGGVSFNGSSNINLPGVNAAGNQNTTGNAATATTAGTVTTAAQPAITSVGTLTSLTVSGDLTVNGTTTTVNTTNIVVEDSLIQLASANAADSVDIGMYGKYVSGGTTYYTGLVRDASASGWHLFTSLTQPSSAGVANLSYSPLRTEALTCTTLTAFSGGEGVKLGNHEIKLTNSGIAHYSIINDDSGYLDFRLTSGSENLGQAGTSLMSIKANGNVGIGTDSPTGVLHISSGTSGDCKLILEADTDNNEEDDNPAIIFKHDGGLETSAILQESNYLSICNSQDDSISGILFKTAAISGGYTNAVERMRITYEGNIGIGTDAPTETLNVVSSSNIIARFEGGNQYGGYLMINTDTTGMWGTMIGYNTNKNFYYKNVQDTDQIFCNNNVTEVMRLKNNGNVGIGTTNPQEKLDVNGCINITPGTGTSWSGETSNSYIKFAGGSIGNDWAVLRQIGSSNAIHLSLDFHDDNNETGFSIRDCHSTASGDPVYTRFMVKRGGNVGIGTNNPGYTLDVNGDAYIRGNSLWLKGAGDDAAQRLRLHHSGSDAYIDWETGRLAVRSDTTEVFSILANGNVGIGNINPLAKLHIESTTDLLYLDNGRAWKFHTNGSSGASTALHLSSTIGGKNFIIDYNGGNKMARFYATATVDDIRVYLCEDGGRVCIGANTQNPAAKLWVEGTGSGSGNNTYGYLNPSGSGTYTASGIAYSIGCSGRMRSTEFNAISDERKKKDFVEISDNTALDLVNQLKVYNYKWKGELDDITLKTGVKAQEVEAIYPSCITQIEEVVPSILEEVVYNNKKFNLTDVSGLAIGDKLKIFYNDKVNLKEKELQAIIVNIIGNEVEIDQEIKDDDDKIYVYGKFYNDVRTIDYNSLNMLSIGAIKSLVTKNNVLENKVATLETELAAIKAHLGL